MGPNSLLYLMGDLKKDGAMWLDEYTAQGNQSAEYGCTFKDGKLMGSFATTGGRTYSLTFNPDKEMQPLPYINVIRGGDTASYDTSIKAGGGSGSSDLLDEYEAYVDELIEFIRKMDKDDPTAMANYFKVMQKAMSLSERLEKERSSLSTGDLERLIQIQQKMNNAIAEMNN